MTKREPKSGDSVDVFVEDLGWVEATVTYPELDYFWAHRAFRVQRCEYHDLGKTWRWPEEKKP